MSAIAHLAPQCTPDQADRWGAIAACALAWAHERNIESRDAIVLVPFAQLLPLARRAFAQSGGWMPRIETTQTLGQALGPAPPPEAGQLSFDRAVDLLSAQQLLHTQGWARAWARRDVRGFEQAAADVVATAHALARAAAAVAPEQRAAYWAQARTLLAPLSGPGAGERLLARVALEWACLAAPPATDRLFELRPSAWLVVKAAGHDALAQSLLQSASGEVPCACIETDAPHELLPGPATSPSLARCDAFEDEAQCAAAQVIEHLRRGEQPVALIAQDRVLVRRVRALLERQCVAMLDETGWKLSTTRAAAQVMALLKAARRDATADDLLDWLKSGTAWPGVADAPAAIAALESCCRRRHLRTVAALSQVEPDPDAAALWEFAATLLRSLGAVRRQPLSAWLKALARGLADCGAWAQLHADEAGRQALAALRLERGAMQLDALATPVTLDEFSAWVDRVLEQETFVPSASALAPVVIVSLARAVLRPFAAVVFPGADDVHLGAPAATRPMLSEALAGELGLVTAAGLRAAELHAFAQVLVAPRVTFLRRRVDATEPLNDSPLLERLALALGRDGRALAVWSDPRGEVSIAATPIVRSAPGASSLLPQRLSASACEALRACPYRFFALHVLRLREDDELDGEIEKRDYGTWLHAVLHRFHTTRGARGPADAEVARLMEVARAVQRDHALDEAEFLPFAATFATFAPRYVAWLHARDADGARWQQGEHMLNARPAELGGVELHGRIDRIDRVRGTEIELIDYKTGSVAALKEKVKQPLEDTQLAFYAALMAPHGDDTALKALYLALDDSKSIPTIEHPHVQRSARALVLGLAQDLQRLRAGAGLAALGEGATCTYCEARGLCRRDHWSATPGGGA